MEQQINNPFEIINVNANRYQTAMIANFAAAFAKFQIEISKVTIEKDQKKKIKSGSGYRELNYASFDNILKHTRPVLAANGLSVIQCLSGEYLETILLHSTGEQIGILTPFAPMSGRGTSEMQNVGGGMTYLCRYAYKYALGLSLEDDLDGADPTPEPKKELPELPEERIEESANVYLKDGTLARVQKVYHIPEKILVQIYCLAKEKATAARNAANEKTQPLTENEAEIILEEMAKANIEQ